MPAAAIFLKAPTQATASQAQLDAGNYKKTKRRFQGLQITIENPKGSVRRGVDRDGHEWETKMYCAYGYINRSMGMDSDPVDVYLGPDEDAKYAYVVHQRKAGDWDKPDEDKVMLGFTSLAAAKAAYLRQYDNPKFLGSVTTMPMDEFKRKVWATKDRPKMIKAVFFKAMRGQPVVCLDFDGVLHAYTSGWKGADKIPDGPVSGAKAAVADLAKRFRVVVNSARCSDPAGRKAIEGWLDKHGIRVSEVTEHKPPAVAYVDDLGVPFQGDWGKVISRVNELGGAQ